MISVSVPLTGEGTSESTLSVETSTTDLVLGDVVADRLEPLGDGALGDGLAELGHLDLGHGVCSWGWGAQPWRPRPVRDRTVSPKISDRDGWGWMKAATSSTVASQLTAR